jgi:3-isopropylmalate/(R)-2-methylmalate dehydratase small subunit
MTTVIDGVAVPFDYASVDTDAMFPVSAEDTAARHGYGAALFGRWRQHPDFILNHAPYTGAPILVAGPDFGIGSSRETAVWALRGAGIRAVLAPSFGDIFRSNCVRNEILAGIVSHPDRDRMHAHLAARRGLTVRIDLQAGTAATGDGAVTVPVSVDGFARRCLVEGLDEFAVLAAAAAATKASLARNAAWAPDTLQIFPDRIEGDSR